MIGTPDFLGGKEIVRGVKMGPIRDGMTLPVTPEMAPYVRIGGSYRGTFLYAFPHCYRKQPSWPIRNAGSRPSSYRLGEYGR
jgi:hypothetical protein